MTRVAAIRKSRAPETAVEPIALEFRYPISKSIGFLMHGTMREMRALLRSRLRAHGLDIGVWFYLRMVWEEDGLTQKELTRRVGDVQPSSVAALRSLAAHGLVTIARDPDDKRKTRISLTREGRVMKRRMLRVAEEVNDRIELAGFTDKEAQQLRDYMVRIRANVSAHVKGKP
jgi:DNA-binding MarR family transcriptional regulator